MGYTVSRDSRRLKHADVVVTSYGVLVSDCRAWLAQQEAAQAQAQAVSGGTAVGGAAAAAGARVEAEGGSGSAAASAMLRPGLLRQRWHRVILDEAHVIKNHHTEVRARAMRLLVRCLCS